MTWWEHGSEQRPPEGTPVAGPVFVEGRATRIMPLGDSITRGQGWEPGGGYRRTLWEHLAASGKSVTPVGGMGSVAPRGYQAEGGWRTEDQSGVGDRNKFGFNAVDSVRVFKPDVILLHLGTNSVGGGVTTNQLADYITTLRSLLDSIYAFAPATHVFIARITLLENQWDGTKWYNNLLQAMVEEYITAGRPYHLVLGMEGMPAGSWADGLHPNEQGYRYMAGVWRDALLAQP